MVMVCVDDRSACDRYKEAAERVAEVGPHDTLLGFD